MQRTHLIKACVLVLVGHWHSLQRTDGRLVLAFHAETLYRRLVLACNEYCLGFEGLVLRIVGFECCASACFLSLPHPVSIVRLRL